MSPNPQGRPPQNEDGTNPLFIFVNGRRYTEATGVKTEMNYAEIAALDGVTERQVVRRVFPGMPGDLPPRDVTADETVKIEAGQRFTAEVKPLDADAQPRPSGVQEPHPLAAKPTPVQPDAPGSPAKGETKRSHGTTGKVTSHQT